MGNGRVPVPPPSTNATRGGAASSAGGPSRAPRHTDAASSSGGGGGGGDFATALVTLTNDHEEEGRRMIARLPDPNDPAVIAATIKLQSAGRGHLARVAANNLRTEHAQLCTRDRAATVIQAALKGWKDRVAVRRRRVDIAHGQQTCVCNKPPRGKMAMCQVRLYSLHSRGGALDWFIHRPSWLAGCHQLNRCK